MNVDKEVAALQRMAVGQLREKYAEVFGEPTRTGNKVWLVKRIIWRMQALVEGDISERSRQRAAELANDADLRTSAPRAPKSAPAAPERTISAAVAVASDDRLPPPGTILMREYNEYAVPPQFTDSDVILDIGAHVGAFTRACLRRGAGHVVAVEPLAANVSCLQHNIGGYESRVTIRNVAAWDADTTLVLNEASCHEPGNTSTFSAFLPAAEQGWEVQAVNIDTLIDEACALSPRGRVRLLKIDAEGAEYPTLLTAQQLHLVDEICGESHNNVPWQDDLPGIVGLTRRLEEQGFVVTHIDNGPNTSIFWARRQPC